MSGTAACTQVNVPVRLTAMIRSHFSGVMSSTGVERLDAGAGDEDLDRPELGADPRERGVDRARSATSTSTARRSALALQLGGGGLGRRLVAVEDGDAVAVGDELAGDAEPDAGRAAGDDGDAAHRPASTGSNSRCSLVRPRRIQVGS